MPFKGDKIYLYLGGLLLGGLGIILVLVRQSTYGVGLMIDSLTHTSTAESLVDGEGFITAWNNRPQQGQPPLYALLLALIASLDLDGKISVTGYAGYLGAIVFSLTVFASISWLSFRIKSRMLIIAIASICALSPVLGDLFSYALTEVLFVLFAVLSLFTLDRFLDSNKISMLSLAALFTAFAWLTRHLGIILVIVSFILLITRRGLTFRQKFKYVLVCPFLSTLPASLWMLKNYIVLGQFTERRWPTSFDWITHINLVSSELTKWIVGTTGFNYLNELSQILGVNAAFVRVIFVGLVIAFFGSILIYLHYRSMKIDSEAMIVPVVFILVYLIIMSVSLELTDIELEARYLLPIYIPALIVAAIILDHCLTYISRTGRSVSLSSSGSRCTNKAILRLIIIAGLSLHFTLVIFSNYGQIKLWRNQGFEYSSKAWVSSETIRYLKSNPVEGWIYSNEARAVYIHMDVADNVEIYYNQLQAELPDETRYWDDKTRAENLNMYVIWFFGWKQFIPTRYDFTQLVSLLELDIVVILEDGIILKANDSPITSTLLTGDRGNKLIFEYVLQGAELVADSVVDIYSDGIRLIYISTSCHTKELEVPFFLHVFPANPADISDGRETLNFNNHDFKFNDEGFSFGDQCAVIRNLPDYDIEMIRTGQFTDDGVELWEESLSSSSLSTPP